MNHRDLLDLFRSSHWTCSVKKGILKNFANFTGKHLCWSLFLITLQLFRLATSLKIDSKTDVFLRNLRIFKNTYFEIFVSPQNTITNSNCEFGLSETSTECKASIFLNITTSFQSNAAIKFICKLKKVSLTFQLTFLLNS